LALRATSSICATGRDAMKRFVVAFVFLLTTVSLGAAEPPFTRR
jgi:hypothetical protein